MRIAIIEQRKGIRKDLIELLQQHGHTVSGFRAGWEFVDQVVQDETTPITAHFDLAIMNMELPDVSDPQAIATLIEIFPKFPIILLADDITKYLQSLKKYHSSIAILQKPFTLAALKKSIERAIPNPK